ncbi:MAG TPA: KamA family radical SAM protein [archaeon]|nr:KamA family radical SAM protein [archaeon]
MSLPLENSSYRLPDRQIALDIKIPSRKEKSVTAAGEPLVGITLEKILRLNKEELTRLLWSADRNIHEILLSSSSLFEARNDLFRYLNRLERSYFNIYSDSKFKDLHDFEKKRAKSCIRVLKNIIRTENENLVGASALKYIWKLSHGRPKQVAEVNRGFLCELIYLFSGINGKLAFYKRGQPLTAPLESDNAPGLLRSSLLDKYSDRIKKYLSRYHNGLEPEIYERRCLMIRKIMEYFGAGPEEWNDCQWQLKHIIRDLATLEKLVELSDEERQGLVAAEKHRVPFQITPYYLSLFDPQKSTGRDTAVRAQVLPNKHDLESLIHALESGKDLDFMGESSTSPIDGVTRRYAQVLILKAFESCPQICVYCQRNWELKGLGSIGINRKKLKSAIEWIAANDHIEEVLVTGGDPLTLNDKTLAWILDELVKNEHLERIRISTRVPVTMPCRITGELIQLLLKYHDFGRREVCIVTHFESGLEMTPEALEAIKRLRAAGFNIYNQQVFTYYTSKKFETSALRKLLKRCGVDPYYCFNTKGKEETKAYRVPIARLLQEWTEEARLLPGMVRTDTPVFNVPTLGKSYLQSWQDHEILMILPDGMRVYRFYPWETMLALTSPYLYTDVSVYDYLRRLMEDGEDVNDYLSIWYYF